MSMATRCIACGTIFRVVQDQLKVSEGWVRCGRCDEVFNALDGLFDLEHEQPPPWQPGQVDTKAQKRPGFEKTAADLDEEDRIASRFFRPEQEQVTKTPAETVRKRDRVDFADAEFNTDVLSEEDVGLPPARDPAARTAPARRGAPQFVRHADSAARWRTPHARIALCLATLLLLGGLTLQIGHHFRDYVAVRWPALEPALLAWCDVAHCRLEAPRRIDDVTVESSALTLAGAGGDTFRLALSLRNRGRLPVTMPWVELTLSDSAGQLIARRALSPAEFQVVQPVLAAESEMPMQLLLTAGTSRVSGYSVEAFYP